MAFKVGDTVRLKSGGPIMTVKDATNGKNQEGIDCQWWNAQKDEFQSGQFLEEMLVAASTRPTIA